MSASQPMEPAARALLEEGLSRFGRERYPRAAWLHLDREPDRFSARTWAELAEMGWLALGLPEALGGNGDALTDLIPLFVAAGRGLWREPLLPCLGEAAGALLAAPAAPLRDRLLAGIGDGTVRLSHAHRESCAPGAPGFVSTRATRHGGAYALSGRKCFVLAAASSSGMLVSAQLEQTGEPGLFFVERDARGVDLALVATVDSRMAADVTFCGAEAELVASGSEWLAAANRRASILGSAEAAGVMQAVNAATIEHLRNRRQFGQALAQFQALRHRVVDMHIMELEALALVRAVAAGYDAEAPDLDRRLWQLRAQNARAARWVSQQGIQLHGGMGIADELPVGDCYKRVLLLESLLGSADVALERLAAA